MRLTDPVADMLTRVRNALQARHQKVDIPASRLKLEIARILKEEGYISNFKPTEEEGHKVIRIYLKYGANNEAAISKVERVSRPGCRVYVRRSEIPRVLGGMGINILQGHPDLSEVRCQQRSGHLEGGARVAPRMPRLCAPQRDSSRAGRHGDQHPTRSSGFI